MFESDTARRVLGHLPRYRTDSGHELAEAHMREANTLPDDWELPRSSTVSDLQARIDEDPFTDSADLGEVLDSLAAAGYLDRAGDAVSMTAEGFEALTGVTV